jgi:hypothetical protein
MEVNAMPDDSSSQDMRTAWQSQTKETSSVSLELIRYKAQQLDKEMRQRAMGARAALLAIVAASLYVVWRFDQLFVRAGAGVLVLWALNLAYQARKRGWSGRLAPDATMSVSLDFYRQQLERQRLYVRAGGRSLWPVLLSVALFLTPAVRAGLLDRFWPFLTVMVAWAVALIVMERRKLRAVQKEVDILQAR